MVKTKGGVRLSSSRAAMMLVLGLGFSQLGCTSTSGLRSVWPDRPSFLGFWDRRQQPEPDPADDYYAQYMHAARSRASHDQTGGNAAQADGPQAAPGDVLAGDASRSGQGAASRPSRRTADQSAQPRDDDEIVVTLGMPEPLASPMRSSDAVLASTRSTPPTIADAGTNAFDPEPRSTARDIDRPDPAATAPIAASSRSDTTRTEAATATKAAPARAKPSIAEGRAVLARSEARLQSLDTYQVKMTRVERVDGRLQPEEEVVLSVHRKPKEVRLQWTTGPSEGREVIYSTRVDAKSLFVHMAKSAIPLPTMKMAVDSPMVVKSSRHSITEAGFDTIVENLRHSVDQVDAANAAQGRAAYRGIETPPGLDRPSHVFTRRSPGGEVWTVFIDARTLFPIMVVAKNASGELDEKYVYQQVVENPSELASADAFDPNRRWGESKGLLSRLARGGVAADSPASSQPTTR